MSAESVQWRKSSHSGNNGGNCVEVSRRSQGRSLRRSGDGPGVAVRDSKDRGGAVLVFGGRAWEALCGGLSGRT